MGNKKQPVLGFRFKYDKAQRPYWNFSSILPPGIAGRTGPAANQPL